NRSREEAGVTRRKVPISVPMGRAAGVLPRKLFVGTGAIDIDLEGETIHTSLGRGVRYPARWTKAGSSGDAHIDITQTSKRTADGEAARLIGASPALADIVALPAKRESA